LPAHACSVLIDVFPYRFENDGDRAMARFACVEDYHAVVGAALRERAGELSKKYPDNVFVPFVDNSPLDEVYCAAAAGLGVVGEHGLLITPEFGSWVFIGAIVTDREMGENEAREETDGNGVVSAAHASAAALPRCERCGACKAACPVGLDKTRCLSAVTQKKGALTEAEAAALRRYRLLWGCDICQDACPHQGRSAPAPGFAYCPRPTADVTGKVYAWREAALRRNMAILENP